MASRRIEDLDPRIQEGARRILKAWDDAGFDVLVTCTYRSPEEQDELYAQGRTQPGKKVTSAKGGQSFHNHHLALDFVPLISGKPEWDGASPLWKALARIAKDVDSRVVWGGDWSLRKIDKPHLEWHLRGTGADVAGLTPLTTPKNT